MLRKHNKGFTVIELSVVIALTFLLAMPLLALRGQSRERTWQTRCTANLRIIYAAIQNYAEDYDGWICPYYDGMSSTWEDLLKPYTYGGTGSYYYYNPDGNWKYWHPTIFYCPKRDAMGQSGSNAGFYTNYAPNIYVMTVPAPPGTPGPSGGLTKFEYFQDHDNIGMLFEIQGHVAATGTFYDPKILEYVHYGRTNILMLNGTIKRFKLQSTFPVKANDSH